MKKNFITIILLAFTIFSYSQDNVTSKSEKIKNLMKLTGSGSIGVTVANNMIDSFKKSLPEVKDEFWNEFKNEIKAEDLVNLIIPIYDKYFTENEIDELIKFYNTPIGKKMISNLPVIMQESMQAGQKWGEAIGEKALAKLNEKGILKN
jgi:hypothetical protein